MHPIEDYHRSKHRYGVEDIWEPFMDIQIAIGTLAEFDEAEDHSQRDEAQDEVDCLQKFSCLMGRSEFCHRDALAGTEVALFLQCELLLEADCQVGEDYDE
jgi:hypothetical protein